MILSDIEWARCDIMGQKEETMKVCSVKGTTVKVGPYGFVMSELEEIGPPPYPQKTQKYTWELEFDRCVSAHDLAILFERFNSVLNEWQKTLKLPKQEKLICFLGSLKIDACLECPLICPLESPDEEKCPYIAEIYHLINKSVPKK
jgi:hypothetical protein